MTIALSLCVLVAALLGPAQTLAQTRKAACSTATARAKAKRTGRACTQSSRKIKAKRHKHASKKTSQAGSIAGTATVAALCEDGSAPERGSEAGFSCADGSEATCESGATPTASHNGKSLLCPVASESESGATEAECEEEGLECTSMGGGSGEQSCEASASESSGFVCEAEG